MKCGGTGSAEPADDETQQVIDLVKAEVEKKLGKTLATYKAIEVAKQMVAGLNFFVKVDVGEGNYIHLRIYRTLPCHGSSTELSGIIAGKGRSDKLEHFEGFHL